MRSDKARLILFNKPFNVLCQFTDPKGRPTLARYIPLPGLYPAGRLDYDSEGLVALTNAGWLQQAVASPRYKLPKTYWVQVEGNPSSQALIRLAEGIPVHGQITRPALVKRIDPPPVWPRNPPIRIRREIPTAWLELVLYEGRKRQIRHMTAAVNLPALRLIRWSIGPWSLGALMPGEWQETPCPQDLMNFVRPDRWTARHNSEI
jgi:23S rRNA pseudouridine2457 synthase